MLKHLQCPALNESEFKWQRGTGDSKETFQRWQICRISGEEFKLLNQSRKK
uniref:Uncharacterized protein n=1 Tax=Arion vulgaris TaxID=1028688 RepID=A0A0B7B0K9_9EUPU